MKKVEILRGILLSWWPIAAIAAAGILYAPWLSGFAWGGNPCIVTMDLEDAIRTSQDVRHVAPFAVLYALCYRQFESGAGWKSAALLVGYSLFMEWTQSFSALGNCRAWDLFANLVGMAAAWAAIRCIGPWVRGGRDAPGG